MIPVKILTGVPIGTQIGLLRRRKEEITELPKLTEEAPDFGTPIDVDIEEATPKRNGGSGGNGNGGNGGGGTPPLGDGISPTPLPIITPLPEPIPIPIPTPITSPTPVPILERAITPTQKQQLRESIKLKSLEKLVSRKPTTRKLNQGFDVVTGMMIGRKRTIAKNLPFFKALKKGSSFVDMNKEIAFKLKPTKRAAKEMDLPFFNVGKKFTKRNSLFIEKPQFRFDSPLERRKNGKKKSKKKTSL